MVMKRRKRTRSSKVANPPTPKIPVDGEKSAGPSIVLDEADHRTPPRDELIAAVETETPAEPSVVFDEAERQTPPRDELIAAVETEKSVEPSAALAGADRRTHPRYEFTAAVEVVAPESRETSWLAANRRRSQRVLMTIPVRVSGKTDAGLPFGEETHTRAISAHGALIPMSTQVYRGQRLTLSNVQTRAALECVVAHIDRSQGEHPQAGVEFTLPNPMFWHVAFPPKDWTPRHPDAKYPVKTRDSS